MKINILVATALAFATVIPAANALTIVNQDKAAYKLTVTPTGGKAKEVDLKANGKVNAACKKGCDVSFNNQTMTYEAKTKQVMIKDGKFVPASM
jgi:hypothetical protein